MSYIKLDNVTLEYELHSVQTLKSKAINLIKQRRADNPTRMVGLDRVTLTIEQGDRVAILGANGSGKTTLLKVMSGIYEPGRGCVEVEGKLASLTDMTLGLDINQSGRKNIVIRYRHLGYSKKMADQAAMNIIEFADIGNFIDQPVSSYSSGMLMRLAFGIATSNVPDIIIMDEWLSVGDENFIKKAEKRLHEIIGKSSIMVLASHSLPLLEEWCNKAILMQNGKAKNYSSVSVAVKDYLDGTLI